MNKLVLKRAAHGEEVPFSEIDPCDSHVSMASNLELPGRAETQTQDDTIATRSAENSLIVSVPTDLRAPVRIPSEETTVGRSVPRAEITKMVPNLRQKRTSRVATKVRGPERVTALAIRKSTPS